MAITEADIRDLATSRSYEKGEDYYYTNAVINVEKRGNLLIAEVEGSSYEPYEVTIEVDENTILATDCTCPYDWGGICKHIVAVLLAYIRQPKRIEERPSPEDLLANVSDTDVRKVLLELLKSDPHLLDRAETILATLAAQSTTSAVTSDKSGESATSALLPEVNPTAFRRQVQQTMRSAGYDEYYNAGLNLCNSVSDLLKQVDPFLDAIDGASALAILEVIIEPLIGEWYNYDHEGEMGEAFSEAGALLTEAILSVELSKAERKKWVKQLHAWEASLSNYGIDGTFEAAITAAEQGWDYAPLQAVFQGHITEQGAWQGEIPYYADELALARLNMLERQGRPQEYLYLAEAEGQTACYLIMLVKLDRGAEAVDYAMKYAGSASEALTLARVLHARGQTENALKIAEHGLTLHSQSAELVRWLRDVAATAEKPELAVNAAVTAFQRTHLLEDYEAAQKVVGSQWERIKPGLLTHLKNEEYEFDRIDIYLREGMLEEAMQAVDRQSYADYDTVGKVVDMVWKTHPDWTIKHCKQQAEPIMDQGKSKYYRHTAHWVERAGKAYLAANKHTEWQRYLDGLIQKHARKYALRPLLEDLRKLNAA